MKINIKKSKVFLSVIIIIMVVVFFINCTNPYKKTNYFIANPNYTTDVRNLVKYSDTKIDSLGYVKVFPISKAKIDSLNNSRKESVEDLYKSGKIMSVDEFASNITGYYNTLIGVLVAIFFVFTIISYFVINDKYKKELEDKKDYLSKQLIAVLDDKLKDSVELRETIIKSLTSAVEDELVTKEEIDDINKDITQINEKISSMDEDITSLSEKQTLIIK